jgi:hypothetical protein
MGINKLTMIRLDIHEVGVNDRLSLVLKLNYSSVLLLTNASHADWPQVILGTRGTTNSST